jgi:hypothetical protein
VDPKTLMKRALQRSGFELRRLPRGPAPQPASKQQSFFKMLVELRELSADAPVADDWHFLKYCLRRVHSSHSQLLQDIFVLHALAEKRGGYFVEFGATDGVGISNTYLLAPVARVAVAESRMQGGPALRLESDGRGAPISRGARLARTLDDGEPHRF